MGRLLLTPLLLSSSGLHASYQIVDEIESHTDIVIKVSLAGDSVSLAGDFV